MPAAALRPACRGGTRGVEQCRDDLGRPGSADGMSARPADAAPAESRSAPGGLHLGLQQLADAGLVRSIRVVGPLVGLSEASLYVLQADFGQDRLATAPVSLPPLRMNVETSTAGWRWACCSYISEPDCGRFRLRPRAKVGVEIEAGTGPLALPTSTPAVAGERTTRGGIAGSRRHVRSERLANTWSSVRKPRTSG